MSSPPSGRPQKRRRVGQSLSAATAEKENIDQVGWAGSVKSAGLAADLLSPSSRRSSGPAGFGLDPFTNSPAPAVSSFTAALQQSTRKRPRTSASESASRSGSKPVSRRSITGRASLASVGSGVFSGRSTPKTLDIALDENNDVFGSARSVSRLAIRPVTAPLDADAAMPVIRRIVLGRLSGRTTMPLHQLEAPFEKLYGLVEQAVAVGDSNSVVLTGARGSGKSAVVDAVLAQAAEEYGTDGFYTVRLDGFVHTDDRLAVRDIWRQLGRALDPDEEAVTVANQADTMAKLLATLSHTAVEDEDDPYGIDTTTRAVVFVLAEFDKFTAQPRQTLLYNLFDIAQSRRAPIVVIGLTTRISLADCLEKRVKSRFSHRYIHIHPPSTPIEAAGVCGTALSIDPAHLTAADRAEIGADWEAPVRWWNQCVDAVVKSPQFVAQYVQPTFVQTKSIPAILRSLVLPISTVADLPDSSGQLIRQLINNPLFALSAPAIAPSPLLSPPDSKLATLPFLADLELALLIAACRLDAIHGASACNFNMAYWEYTHLAGQAKVAKAATGVSAIGAGAATRIWGRDVGRKGWERLVATGLLLPAAGGGSKSKPGLSVGAVLAAAADGLAIGLVRPDVGLEEIPDAVPGIDRLFERWCRHA